MTETQDDLLPRSLTFATVALVVFLLVFMVIGIHTYGEDPEVTEEVENGETRRRRCRTARGCFTYFRKSSANLPLWKTVLLKFGVVLVTTAGSTCVSLVINNATANREETIKETIAHILDLDDDFSRKKRETCVDSNDTDCWGDKMQNMIDRPKDLCDTVNEWGDSVDPVFCTLFVSMIIFVLIFLVGLLVPVVAFFLLGPAVRAIKVEEITTAVTESLRRKIENLRNTTASYLTTEERTSDTTAPMTETTTSAPEQLKTQNLSRGAIPKRGETVWGLPTPGLVWGSPSTLPADMQPSATITGQATNTIARAQRPDGATSKTLEDISLETMADTYEAIFHAGPRVDPGNEQRTEDITV